MNAAYTCPGCRSTSERGPSRCGCGRFLVPAGEVAGQPADPWMGRVLADRYATIGRIGSGLTGHIYRAIQLALDRLVAIKVLNTEIRRHPELAIDVRFEQEARALADLQHPNIVPILDYAVTADGTPYIVEAFMRGRNLLEVSAGSPMPVRRALGIARQIACALGAAHAKGILHRDLKPQNVMIGPCHGYAYHATVLDFGLARFVAGPRRPAERLTQRPALLGTVQYMAPEQGADGPLIDESDHRADIYALGTLLFRMLTAQLPFPQQVQDPFALLREKASRDAPAFSEIRPDLAIPEGVQRIVYRALTKDPGGRYPDCASMIGDLDDVLDGDGGDAAEEEDTILPGRPLVLEVLANGAAVGRHRIVGDRAVIGRRDPLSGITPDVDLSAAGVSRKHCELMLRRGRWFVVDLGSAHGTFLRGERLAPAVRRVIEDLDELMVGELTLRVLMTS